MSASTMEQQCYIYGIIAADASLPEGLEGLEGPVSTIRHRDVAAVVGALPSRPLGRRDDLLTHERVVEAVAGVTTILPARFAGAVNSTDAVVEEMLAPYHDNLVAALHQLQAMHQFTLRGAYETDVVLREIAAQDEEIGRLREEILELGEERSYAQRIRQGELVVQRLQERRAADSERILSRLEPVAASMSVEEPGRPDEVINTAFLVQDSRRAQFEQAVEDLGREYADRLRLRLLGPLPPYDFVPGM